METTNDTPIEIMINAGVRLGQSHAHGMIAGRCSAARAAAIRSLREDKLYKSCTPYWSEFCSKYLKISKTQADRIIRLLDEFGPTYFEVAELTRMSPEVYRAIQPNFQDGALQWNGEAIELIEENSDKVAAAVADLRSELPKIEEPPPSVPERLQALERRCENLAEEFVAIAKKERSVEHWQLTLASLEKCRSVIDLLDQEMARMCF